MVTNNFQSTPKSCEQLAVAKTLKNRGRFKDFPKLMIKLNHFYNARDRISVKWKLCENSKHFQAILNTKSFVKVIVNALSLPPSPFRCKVVANRLDSKQRTKSNICCELSFVIFSSKFPFQSGYEHECVFVKTLI